MILSFKNLIEKYQINVSGIIHIGAHYGTEVSDYVNFGIDNIVLFEPLEKNFDILKENIKDLNADIDAYCCALGNDNKKIIMNISSNEAQSSSILSPKVHLTAHPEVIFDGTEEVQMRKLDDFDFNNCNMLVIDVQGYELEVLKGATKTLNDIKYIYCEVNRDEVYENNAYIEDIDKFLLLHRFNRVETQWYYTEVWGDAFYIKSKTS
jgi:FkbM family methyltransferase